MGHVQIPEKVNLQICLGRNGACWIPEKVNFQLCFDGNGDVWILGKKIQNLLRWKWGTPDLMKCESPNLSG